MKSKKYLVEMYDDDDESTNAPEVLFKETVGGNMNVDFFDFHSFLQMKI